MKKIALIIPIFNEEKNIPFLYATLLEIIDKQQEYLFEMVFVNDGSRDNSLALLYNLARQDERISVINLSRNFGHQLALTAGYDYVEADAVITMDADMQDPPALIVDLLAEWQKGNHIVYARRQDRQDTFLKKWTALLYYRVLDMISDVKIPRNVGDFRLIDRVVLEQLKACREKARYLRGMVSWLGFKQSFVNFKRPERYAGTTGYTWKKMIKLAFDGVTGFSLFPLKLAAFIGTFVIGTGSLMFGYITLDATLYGVYYPLFKWLVTIVYIFMGVQFLLLWLIGEYIGRMYDQLKNRPLYIVEHVYKSNSITLDYHRHENNSQSVRV